jgi:hypothetical protein
MDIRTVVVAAFTCPFCGVRYRDGDWFFERYDLVTPVIRCEVCTKGIPEYTITNTIGTGARMRIPDTKTAQHSGECAP